MSGNTLLRYLNNINMYMHEGECIVMVGYPTESNGSGPGNGGWDHSSALGTWRSEPQQLNAAITCMPGPHCNYKHYLNLDTKSDQNMDTSSFPSHQYIQVKSTNTDTYICIHTDISFIFLLFSMLSVLRALHVAITVLCRIAVTISVFEDT